MHSLAIYEEKLIQLKRLRAELIKVSDKEAKLDLTAGIADIRNQQYMVHRQCRDIMGEVHKPSALGKMADKEVEEEKSSSSRDWLKWFIALAVVLGLLYLVSPESFLHKLLDFPLNFFRELECVNGPPLV